MMDFEFDSARSVSPLDCVERLASRNDWYFDREGDEEIAVSVEGRWANYQVSVTWLPQMEALHVGCGFDLKAPERRRAEIMQLVSMINERMWIGHFDLWSADNVVLFRHALILAGGAQPTDEQAAALISTAVEACENYYQAFQFVVWAGKTAREALDSALIETAGEA